MSWAIHRINFSYIYYKRFTRETNEILPLMLNIIIIVEYYYDAYYDMEFS